LDLFVKELFSLGFICQIVIALGFICQELFALGYVRFLCDDFQA